MRSFINLCFIFLVLITTVSAQAEKIPFAVSPGNDVGVAIVEQSCPTFSWTAVDWAVGYRVEVFHVVSNDISSYEAISVMSYPVLTKEIRGAGTSWTPSSYEGLSNEGVYVWYVQAFDAYGAGAWSAGKMFKVEEGAGFAAIEETVSETLKEHGVSKEIISDVIDSVRTTARKESGSQGNVAPIGIQGNEVGDNTYYGQYAGLSLTTGEYNTFMGYYAGTSSATADHNSFFGANAGNLNTTGYANTFIGSSAGWNNTTGYFNTFLGTSAGQSNTTGSFNTFLGTSAGSENTTGYENTFMGFNAGNDNTTGINNTFIGWSAGTKNTTGDYNTFIGPGSGFENTIGIKNTFLGAAAGIKNTSGNENTFLGHIAGRYNTTGSNNIFIGSSAGETNTTGINNTFIGSSAGETNTTGNANTFIGQGTGYSNTEGEQNTFMGPGAGYNNTTGDYNAFIGTNAGTDNTSGYMNTFMGWVTGNRNTTGISNTFIGARAGYENTTGTSNTFLGYRAGTNNTTGNANVFLGNRAGFNETASNKLYIDNSETSDPLIWGDFSSDVFAINGTIGVNTHSPAFPMEMKQTGTNASIVVDRTDGATNYINATSTSGNFGTVTNHVLRLVVGSQWKMRLHTDNSLTFRNGASCTSGGVWTNASSRDLKENINNLTAEKALDALSDLQPVTYNYKANLEDNHVGFIAEDVPDLVASKDRKGMSPMDVVAVLTKVLQEQQNINEELRAEIEELKELLRYDK